MSSHKVTPRNRERHRAGEPVYAIPSYDDSRGRLGWWPGGHPDQPLTSTGALIMGNLG